MSNEREKEREDAVERTSQNGKKLVSRRSYIILLRYSQYIQAINFVVRIIYVRIYGLIIIMMFIIYIHIYLETGTINVTPRLGEINS